MQKLFSVGTARKNDYPELKLLFQEIFGDSSKAVNNFFEKTVCENNIVCVRDGEKIVSMLYIVDCEIHFKGVFYKSAYIYAVGTRKEYRGLGCMKISFNFLEKLSYERGYSYLILVPENDGLIKMYKKLGFELSVTASSVKLTAAEKNKSTHIKSGCCSYEMYRNVKIDGCQNIPAVILGEKGFKSFFYPADEGIYVIHSADGYCIYEKIGGKICVHEIFGNKKSFIQQIYAQTNINKIYLYEPSNNTLEPFGMIKALDNSPKLNNVFMGIAYGG